MKRSIIAVAAVLLLLGASTTYASPRRPRRPRFWGAVFCWLGLGHHEPIRMARPHPHGHRLPALEPGHRGGPPPGGHWGWRNGRHEGWNRNDPPRGRRPDGGRPRERERGHGRG